jgi:hypothetical protein
MKTHKHIALLLSLVVAALGTAIGFSQSVPSLMQASVLTIYTSQEDGSLRTAGHKMNLAATTARKRPPLNATLATRVPTELHLTGGAPVSKPAHTFPPPANCRLAIGGGRILPPVPLRSTSEHYCPNRTSVLTFYTLFARNCGQGSTANRGSEHPVITEKRQPIVWTCLWSFSLLVTDLIPIVLCPELGPKLVEHLSGTAIVFCTQITALWS